MYEYQSIEVPIQRGFYAQKGGTFHKCMEIVKEQAKQGWKLVQIIAPVNEKSGTISVYAYEIVFEKTISDLSGTHTAPQYMLNAEMVENKFAD